MNKAFITGATGFIGGRLAEMLQERGVPAVALVRTWSAAARLSRLPVEMVSGDVLDFDVVRRAMAGCDVVFHCAVDWRGSSSNNRRSSIVGTGNVLRAAREAGVNRVVFLSSVAVFGRRLKRGVLTEADPTPYTGDPYGDGKIGAERLALQVFQDQGVPVTILRPTIVYGPFGRSWTVGTVAAIRDGRMVLVNGGTGVCNALYVDNLIDAMLLAARHPQAPGEVFHISDARSVTWGEFIRGHARALGDGHPPLSEMSVEEIEALRRRSARPAGSSVKQTLRLLRDPKTRGEIRSIPAVARAEGMARAVYRILPERAQRALREAASRALNGQTVVEAVQGSPRPLLQRSLVHTYSMQTTFSVEKARTMLGYEPAIDFEEGMARTAAWIQWARL